MTDISVVIPTYNRKNILLRTIKSLFDQTYPKDKYEIIIVDDGSADGTMEAVEKIVRTENCTGGLPAGKAGFKTRPDVSYIKQSPSKKGPAAANNLGIKAAKGKYILLMNNDVIADPRLIEEHMKDHVNASHAKHQQRTGKDIIVQGRVINTSSMEELGKKHKGYTGGYNNFSFGYFTTWNCSLSKEILLKAGLFDEDFRNLCWEDVELGFRLRKMGIKQKNNKNAFGYHFRHEFSMKDIGWVKDKSLKMGGNAMIYYKKHPVFEVKISTENFWLPMMMQSIFTFIINLIGKNRIYGLMNSLEQKKQYKLLAFMVGLAGKYWFWTGVKQSRTIYF
ncbi:MAG: glycosyltransferase [Candidatus Margulisiibacteriota bacterium]